MQRIQKGLVKVEIPFRDVFDGTVALRQDRITGLHIAQDLFELAQLLDIEYQLLQLLFLAAGRFGPGQPRQKNTEYYIRLHS